MRRSVYVVAALIEGADGRILLDRRSRGTHLEGRWEFPGGKREHGETDAQALKRELLEELGVDSDIREEVGRVLHTYDGFDLTLVLYRARIRGEPEALDVAEIGWFEREALLGLMMPPADRPLVEAVLKLPRPNA